MKQRHAGLRAFFQTFSDEFEMFSPEGVEEPEFMVRLAESDALTLTLTLTLTLLTLTPTPTLTLTPTLTRCASPRATPTSGGRRRAS